MYLDTGPSLIITSFVLSVTLLCHCLHAPRRSCQPWWRLHCFLWREESLVWVMKYFVREDSSCQMFRCIEGVVLLHRDHHPLPRQSWSWLSLCGEHCRWEAGGFPSEDSLSVKPHLHGHFDNYPMYFWIWVDQTDRGAAMKSRLPDDNCSTKRRNHFIFDIFVAAMPSSMGAP